MQCRLLWFIGAVTATRCLDFDLKHDQTDDQHDECFWIGMQTLDTRIMHERILWFLESESATESESASESNLTWESQFAPVTKSEFTPEVELAPEWVSVLELISEASKAISVRESP